MKNQSNNFKELGLVPLPTSIKKLNANLPFKKIIDIELAMKSNSLIKKDVLIKDLLIKLCGEASTSA